MGNRVERRQTCQVSNGEQVETRESQLERKKVWISVQVTRQSSDKVEQFH